MLPEDQSRVRACADESRELAVFRILLRDVFDEAVQ
jgi:hypothetical protein